MIDARNVHKVYRSGSRELRVLKGVDLSIQKGESVAIVGHSGAGKSTLLHLLGGLDTPTEGEVVFKGTGLARLSDGARAKIRNRHVGFVFQFYHLLPELSALENVVLPAWVSGGSNGRALSNRAEDLLKTLGLGDRLTHKPNQLSGGEQQRVAIARSLINDPEVLLCDEPTGNLDWEMGEKILDQLFDLNRRLGKTLVMVTHEPDIGRRASRVVRLHDGKVVA